MANVLLDLTGGSLSLLQETLNSVALDKPFFDPGAFNAVKFILSITSILFDTIFIFQHYVLYGDKSKKATVPLDGPELEDGKGLLDGRHPKLPEKNDGL